MAAAMTTRLRTGQVPTVTPPSVWIISGFWDSVLFIGAPLVCAAVLLPFAGLSTPGVYSFLLLAFFTFGHHLPGFLRAYLDKELFERYRLRFLLAPPLVFLTALWFDQRGLHGILIFVFAWDIWHVLMQHFGFMRIYDSKTGDVDLWTSRLDWGVSLSCYVSIIAASPHYRHNLLLNGLASGIPVSVASFYPVFQTALYAVTAAIVAVYAVFCFLRWRAGRLNPRKVATLAVFLAASWYLYVIYPDFLVGFAVWSAFHCLQYYAIVWVYNVNRVAKGSPVAAAGRFLFRPRAALLILYGSLILAYGAINYLRKYVGDPDWSKYLVAFIATSSILHYYYDGFIWKIRETRTRQFLGIRDSEGSLSPGPGWRSWHAFRTHGAGHLAMLGGVVAMLACLELRRPNDDLAIGRALALAAPEVEEAHLRLGDALRNRGDHTHAAAAYQDAIRLKPSYLEAQVNLGVTLASLGRIDEAMAAYRHALALAPGFATARFNLAGLLLSKGDTQAALHEYTAVLGGDDPQARRLAAQAIAQIRGQR